MRSHAWLATSRERLESSWQDTLRGGRRPTAEMEPISAVVDATLSGAAGIAPPLAINQVQQYEGNATLRATLPQSWHGDLGCFIAWVFCTARKCSWCPGQWVHVWVSQTGCAHLM